VVESNGIQEGHMQQKNVKTVRPVQEVELSASSRLRKKNEEHEMMNSCGPRKVGNIDLDHSLSNLHQNIRSIRNKCEEIASSLQIDPHVLCFSEHHMIEQDLLLFKLIRYTLGPSYSRQTFQKGGVYVFVKKDLCSNRTDLT
jgi:hypothetical protein